MKDILRFLGICTYVVSMGGGFVFFKMTQATERNEIALFVQSISTILVLSEIFVGILVGTMFLGFAKNLEILEDILRDLKQRNL